MNSSCSAPFLHPCGRQLRPSDNFIFELGPILYVYTSNKPVSHHRDENSHLKCQSPPFGLRLQERGRPSLDLKSTYTKPGLVIRDQHACFQGNGERSPLSRSQSPGSEHPKPQGGPPDFTARALFSHAERPPGRHRHADDGVRGGDGERGEGDDLHPPVFLREHRRGTSV